MKTYNTGGSHYMEKYLEEELWSRVQIVNVVDNMKPFR
jgi:hypothetical protein